MEVSKRGLNLIKSHEGFRSRPYLDAVGVPTIGYGNTFYPDGRKVSLSDPAISESEASQLLARTLKDFARQILPFLPQGLNQNQFDALLSFAYNLGPGALKTSTLLKRIKANPCDPDIAYQFSRWNKAGGKVLNGLVRRRKEEADLYFS